MEPLTEPSPDSEMSLTIDGGNNEACVPKSSFVPIRQYLDAIIFVNVKVYLSLSNGEWFAVAPLVIGSETHCVQHFGGFTQFQLVKEI